MTTIDHQARCLRRLTGRPLASCRRLILEEENRARMNRRAGQKARAVQLELDEAPMSEEEVSAMFADLRRRLAAK